MIFLTRFIGIDLDRYQGRIGIKSYVVDCDEIVISLIIYIKNDALSNRDEPKFDERPVI